MTPPIQDRLPGFSAPAGLKFDSDKPRFDLIDPFFEEGLAQVLTFGAKKYAPHNWRKGIVYSRLLGALRRHINAIEKGEDTDPETGLLHAYHAACCVMFLARFQHDQRKDLDDRVARPVPKRIRKPTLAQSQQ